MVRRGTNVRAERRAPSAVFRLGGERWVCDSYYLALNRELLPDREDADKVWTVLRRIL